MKNRSPTPKNEGKTARIYFQKAKEIELLECTKLSKLYNGIMEDAAYRRKVPLVDIVSVFEIFNQKHGEVLFLNPSHDFVHPNAKEN